MKNRAVIIHGTMGSPEGNWFPWLTAELKKLGIDTITPRFPTPEGQNLRNWLTTFDSWVGQLTENDILIGHSVGASFVCRVLERQSNPIKAAFLVAGFARQLGDQGFDPFNATFVVDPFDWGKIRSNVKKIYTYAGDKDPYVPLSFSNELAGSLEAPLNVIKGGGHLNMSSGFTRFDQLLADIKTLTGTTLAQQISKEAIEQPAASTAIPTTAMPGMMGKTTTSTRE